VQPASGIIQPRGWELECPSSFEVVAPMPVVEESVVIARPPEAVFDYLAQADTLPEWDSSIVHADQVGAGPVGVGTRWRGISKILGRRFEWTTEITEFDRPWRSSSRSVEGKLQFTVTIMLEPADGGTRFSYRVDAASGLGGVFGRLADPIVERAQARTVRANLETLAELLAKNSET
jgi:uncharacterized membrane protein